MSSKRAAQRIERIQSMEEAYNLSREAVDQLVEAIAAQVDAIDAITALSGYYGSEQWYQDRDADERGALPDDLARGVLGEDLPYEVLMDAREAALGAIEVATQMLRAL
jgi:hypothetical protein